MMIKCDVFIHSTSEHIAQLCTGFSLLESQKRIQLTYNLQPYTRYGKHPLKNKSPYALQGMFVVLNDKITMYYDTSDGENLAWEALEVADLYFKRSYREDAIPDDFRDMVFPLGLNYEVYTDGLNKLDFARFFMNRRAFKSPKQMIRSLMGNLHLKYLPTISAMHARPALSQEPKVLFMARTWDPEDHPAGFTPALAENWRTVCNEVNATRASVITLLRKNLGNRFYGGFSPGSHALAHYKSCLLPDTRAAEKRSYISTLQQYPVCIASTGLYNSIGWKMGEYVAFSKAIVSETLYYEVPGNFSKGKNYLEFTTADQCVEQTYILLEEKDKREAMMENNYQYYKNYLSPDELIWRSLERALGLVASPWAPILPGSWNKNKITRD